MLSRTGLLVGIFFLALRTFAGGTEFGGGGNHYHAVWMDIAREIKQVLQDAPEPSKNVLSYREFKKYFSEAAILRIQVEYVDYPLIYLKETAESKNPLKLKYKHISCPPAIEGGGYPASSVKTAINFSKSALIRVSTPEFRCIPTRYLVSIVAHEYLGVFDINDPSYYVSNYIARQVEKARIGKRCL